MSNKGFDLRSRGGTLRLLLLALAVAALALVAAGCGSSGSSSSSTSESESAEKPEETETKEEGEGGTAGGAELEGKKIGYLDVYASAPIEKRFYTAFTTAAEHVGWSVQLQDAAGEQEKAVAAARNFINSGVEAIVCSSVPSEWLQPIAAEAKSKNIPLVELITPGVPGVYTSEILEPEEETSAALAKRIEEEFPEGVEASYSLEPEIAAEPKRVEGLEAAFEEGSGKITIASTIEVAQIEQPAAQKAAIDTLNAHPGLGAIISASATQTPYLLAGLRSAGNSKVKLFSWYAESINAGLLQENPQLVAVVDSDIAKVGWVATGELLNFFSGGELEEQVFPETTPVIIEKADVTPGMLKNEGPVPFSKIGAPYYAEWKTKYGIGG